MATINSLTSGTVSGRVGDKVYYQLYGKTVVRSLPGKRQGKDSASQQLHRQRFLSIVRFCKNFKFTVIPLVWNELAQQGSGYHLFLKTNSPAFGKEGQITDPKMIRLSMGKLPIPDGFTARRMEGDPLRVEVAWERDKHLGGVQLWDELLAVSTNNEQYSDVIATGITRNNLGGSFALPDPGTAATHLYLFFGSFDKKRYSESVCFEL